MLARFARGGVEEFSPADAFASPGGPAFLSVEETARATAIGVRGPGFAILEALEAEPSPVAAALDRLCTAARRVRKFGRDQEAASGSFPKCELER